MADETDDDAVDPDDGEFLAEWDRRHADPGFAVLTDEHKDAVRTYFRYALTVDWDEKPTTVELHAALALLEDWMMYRDPEADTLVNDGPLPPDLAAHADEVIPMPASSDMDDDDWTWAGAMFTIGCNHRIFAQVGTADERMRKLDDAYLFFIGQLRSLETPELSDEVRQAVERLVGEATAAYEVSFGREPSLLDPALFDLGFDDETPPDSGE